MAIAIAVSLPMTLMEISLKYLQNHPTYYCPITLMPLFRDGHTIQHKADGNLMEGPAIQKIINLAIIVMIPNLSIQLPTMRHSILSLNLRVIVEMKTDLQ